MFEVGGSTSEVPLPTSEVPPIGAIALMYAPVAVCCIKTMISGVGKPKALVARPAA